MESHPIFECWVTNGPAVRSSANGIGSRNLFAQSLQRTLQLTREQHPFNFSRFRGWFAGVEKKALPLGDYSVAGLEDVCVVERKDLSDLVHSCTADRIAFVKRLKLTAMYPHQLLVVTSTLSQVKSPYPHASVDPNRTTQFLIAVLAGLQVPFICSEMHELGEEFVGSYLYQVHLYHSLESHDYGRFLLDNDL
jgi:hypothetical protein